MPALRVLDQMQSLADLVALEADPDRYATALAAELPAAATLAELEARDAMLAGALGHIDAMIARAMKIRLDHVLASDTTIGAPTRKVFATTVVGYANNLPLLAQRVRDVAARGGSTDPDHLAEAVVVAATLALGLRDAVRAGVLALIRSVATVAIVDADRHARDRTLADAQRMRWSAMRRDLEAVAADPARVVVAAMAARLAALPEHLDELAAEPEVTFADLIELD
ncbi:MAG: hypothetical protein ABI867_05860 [Kofleriaceae bacterium]